MREIKIRKNNYIFNQIIIVAKSLYEVLILKKELSNISDLKVVIPDKYISFLVKIYYLKGINLNFLNHLVGIFTYRLIIIQKII